MIDSEHLALTGWYKSSYSGGEQGECLEVAPGRPDVPVRDSKAAHRPALVFSQRGWTAFVAAVKDGHIGGQCSDWDGSPGRGEEHLMVRPTFNRTPSGPEAR